MGQIETERIHVTVTTQPFNVYCPECPPGGTIGCFCRSVTEGTSLHLRVLAYRTSLFRIGPR